MYGTPLKDRVGERYGYIKIIDYGYKETPTKRRGTLTFECDCGTVKTVLAHNITQGRIKSCGCKSNELKAHYKHGMHKSRIYQTYHDMLQRCFNSNNPRFHRYGGRGITVCEQWRESFNNFYTWAMNNGYTDELTIERIDNNGNYCPENCKWATMEEQLKNRDTTNMGGYRKCM